jgi:hypothetical protein
VKDGRLLLFANSYRHKWQQGIIILQQFPRKAHIKTFPKSLLKLIQNQTIQPVNTL